MWDFIAFLSRGRRSHAARRDRIFSTADPHSKQLDEERKWRTMSCDSKRQSKNMRPRHCISWLQQYGILRRVYAAVVLCSCREEVALDFVKMALNWGGQCNRQRPTAHVPILTKMYYAPLRNRLAFVPILFGGGLAHLWNAIDVTSILSFRCDPP